MPTSYSANAANVAGLTVPTGSFPVDTVDGLTSASISGAVKAALDWSARLLAATTPVKQVIGVGGAPAYATGWGPAVAGNGEPLHFYKGADGSINIGGVFKRTGAAGGGTVFTLPAGFISSVSQIMPIAISESISMPGPETLGMIQTDSSGALGTYLILPATNDIVHVRCSFLP